MEIRVLTEQDHDAVEELSRDLWQMHCDLQPERHVGDTYTPTKREPLVDVGAFCDGKLVGIALCDHNTKPTIPLGFVRKLYVRPEYRMQGVATSMFDFLRERLKELGMEGFKLGVVVNNEKALKFYHDYGLTEVEHIMECKF